jgi:DNA-binding NtrC family response regulator
VDVRVVAATHRDLERDVREGRFREDLYYRLKVVELELPPLRERREDLPGLAERFLQQLAERHGRPRKRLAPAALAELSRHTWPGNVRELRNAVERAAVLAAGDEIEVEDLALPRSEAATGEGGAASDPGGDDVPFGEAKRREVERFERAYLLRALRENEGNISRTAEAIGMVRQSLQQKIRELGLRDEDWSRS